MENDSIPTSEVDSDTLMQILKDKAKELKSTQKKLKKVEDKFVDMHKSQKSLVNDRDAFIQFLHFVFPQKLLEEEILTFQDGPEGYGQIDYNHLMGFYLLHKKNQEAENNVII